MGISNISNKEKLIKLLNIKALNEFDINRVDKFKSMEYISGNILMSIDNDLIVKDPLNMQITVLKNKIKVNNIFLLEDTYFDNMCEQIISSSENKIEGVEVDSNESTGLDNTKISALLNQIFYAAKVKNVSDIHIDPKKDTLKVFFRTDGKLTLYKDFPLSYAAVVLNKIKSESGMDIFNKNLPQDGKLKTLIDNETIELRVSTLPTIYGENAVMRLVNTSNVFNMKLPDMGFEKEDLEVYRDNFKEPYGMIINVGATGAGKTTTFYLTLHELTDLFPEKKICTVEDPVEIRFDKVLQVQAQDSIGLTFPVVLKSLLRQDPDIILIGEMRDSDTANIAVKSALTGHLVLSTLHATDSFNAITRLRDLNIDDTLLSSTLSCILSQRLSRKLCKCRESYDIPEATIKKYNLDFNVAYKPVGCSSCNYTGYKGRTAIIELWDIDEEYKNAISENKGEIDIKKMAKRKGMQNLWINGLKKIKRGEVSFEELLLTIKPDKTINSITNNEEIEEIKNTI